MSEQAATWRVVTRAGNSVALRVLPALSSLEADAAWSAQAALLPRLQHPGLVRVHAAFSRGGKRYVITDLEEGTPLPRWLEEHPDAPVTQRLTLLRTIAAALDAMHAGAGTDTCLVHGAVTAENILVRPDGSTVLVDPGALDGSAGEDSYAFIVVAAETLTGASLPRTPLGAPDLPAVQTLLRTNPNTARHHHLSQHISSALAAPIDARPSNLRRWLDSGSEPATDIGAEFVSAPMSAAEVPSAHKGISPAQRTWMAAAAAVLLVVATAVIANALHRPRGSNSAGAQNSPELTTPESSASTASPLTVTSVAWILGCGEDSEVAVPPNSGDILDLDRFPASQKFMTSVLTNNGGSWYRGRLRFTLRNDSDTSAIVSNVRFRILARTTDLGSVSSPRWIYRPSGPECLEPTDHTDRSYTFDLVNAEVHDTTSGTPEPVSAFQIPAHESRTIEVAATVCGDNLKWQPLISVGVLGRVTTGALYSYGNASPATVYSRDGSSHRHPVSSVEGADPRCVRSS